MRLLFLISLTICCGFLHASVQSTADVCLQPPPSETTTANCSQAEELQYYYYSIAENYCMAVMGCPPPPLEPALNYFSTLKECLQHCHVECPLPSQPTNGTYQMINNNTLNYTCDIGYALYGSRGGLRKCQRNGQWNGPEPLCIIDTCKLPTAPANGLYTLDYTSYSYLVLKYSCNPGFTLNGPSERSCLHDNTWTGVEPKCLNSSEITCPEPEHVPKVTLYARIGCEHNRYNPGCFLVYGCESEHYWYISGDFWRYCNPNGEWTGTALKCGRVYITHGNQEVTEVKTNQGEKNVQVNCKMEPDFPSHSLVEWKSSSSDSYSYNTSWVDDNTYALQFPEVRISDSGAYTCSMTYSGLRHIERSINIEVISPISPEVTTESPPTASIMPNDIIHISSDKIELRGIFDGSPKPTVTWYKGNKTISGDGDRITIDDRMKNKQTTTFSVLRIKNPTSDDFGIYRCIAVNSAGLVAYDIIVSEPPVVNQSAENTPIHSSMVYRRSVDDNSPNKKISYCSDSDTAVFIGSYTRKLLNNSYFVKVKRQIPSKSPSDKTIHLKDIVKILDPKSYTEILVGMKVKKNHEYIFITKPIGDQSYELVVLLPSTVEKDLTNNVCITDIHS